MDRLTTLIINTVSLTDSHAPCEKFDNTVMLGPTIKDRVLSLIRTIIY